MGKRENGQRRQELEYEEICNEASAVDDATATKKVSQKRPKTSGDKKKRKSQEASAMLTELESAKIMAKEVMEMMEPENSHETNHQRHILSSTVIPQADHGDITESPTTATVPSYVPSYTLLEQPTK